jgi:hypothetical protein
MQWFSMPLFFLFIYTNNIEIYMWPLTALMQPKGMLSTKELQVGKRYKQRNARMAAGYDPCKTLTRKTHLRDGKYYELIFHIGKKPSGRFYNSTDNPIFKRCATRRVRRGRGGGRGGSLRYLSSDLGGM